ncbi:hypothetical protein GCM10009642_23310 [Nocardiopsis metallicus]
MLGQRQMTAGTDRDEHEQTLDDTEDRRLEDGHGEKAFRARPERLSLADSEEYGEGSQEVPARRTSRPRLVPGKVNGGSPGGEHAERPRGTSRAGAVPHLPGTALPLPQTAARSRLRNPTRDSAPASRTAPEYRT